LPVTIHTLATDTHTRYVLVFPDSPAIANIHTMITNHDADELTAILVVTSTGESEPVQPEQDEDTGTWFVVQSGNDGSVIEEIKYDDNGDTTDHLVFVDGFDTDAAPILVAN
jgi:hypothetical protein